MDWYRRAYASRMLFKWHFLCSTSIDEHKLKLKTISTYIYTNVCMNAFVVNAGITLANYISRPGCYVHCRTGIPLRYEMH